MIQGQDIGQEVLDFTLVSSLTSVPGSTTSNFTTRYPVAPILNGLWKVGLTSMSFTKNINNIPETTDGLINLNVILTRNRVQYSSQISHNISVGIYATPDILIKEIYKIFKSVELLATGKESIIIPLETLMTLEFHPPTSMLSVEVSYEQVDAIEFDCSTMLRNMLGLTGPLNLTRQNRTFSFPRNVDIKAGVYIMYIMCDSIEQSFTGEITSQLLRSVGIPPRSEFDDSSGYTSLTFDDVQWRSVKFGTDKLSRINIKILEDPLGGQIKFPHGGPPVMLNLKFVKVA